MTDSTPLLGRCKECDFALFATREQVIDAASFKEVQQAGMPYRVGNNGHFARCPNRHKVFVLKGIKGTYSAEHKCDARCLNAKGHSCTCSCGGMNHGRGHASVVHEAGVVIEAPATEKQIKFIESLIDQVTLTDEQLLAIDAKLQAGLTKAQASAWIERLIELRDNA
jgi:hypothetical protein